MRTPVFFVANLVLTLSSLCHPVAVSATVRMATVYTTGSDTVVTFVNFRGLTSRGNSWRAALDLRERPEANCPEVEVEWSQVRMIEVLDTTEIRVPNPNATPMVGPNYYRFLPVAITSALTGQRSLWYLPVHQNNQFLGYCAVGGLMVKRLVPLSTCRRFVIESEPPKTCPLCGAELR